MPSLRTRCVNAHDRCEGSAPCPYCEPVIPLRGEDGKFVPLRGEQDIETHERNPDMNEAWKCHHRAKSFANCSCARFNDGGCVPPDVYPVFARRRDKAYAAAVRTEQPVDRAFADRNAYENA